MTPNTRIGPITGAAGVQGFLGEGYPHHKFLKPLGLIFDGCTFVAKTTTLEGNKGNMPMKDDGITPKELLPRCILPNFRPGKIGISLRMFLQGLMLNAVKLSGPGAKPLFEDGRWQERTEDFGLSFMPISPTREQRFCETEKFVKLAAGYLPRFKARVFLQINISCPNVGLEIDELVYEARTYLDIAGRLGIKLMPKLNVLTPVIAVKQIAEHPNCAALCISNTILWGKLPDRINWKELFGTDVSPLAEFGGGGLSGWLLLAFVEEWIRHARRIGITKHINAGGGIQFPRDVDVLKRAGASSVFVGSVASLRWWRLPGIIRRAHQIFGEGGTI